MKFFLSPAIFYLKHEISPVIEYSVVYQSECGEMLTRITQNTDTFHAVFIDQSFRSFRKLESCSRIFQITFFFFVT